MSKRHFIVSIKTIDDMLLFPTDFNGEVFLLGATAKASEKTGVIFKGYASFPTGLELVLYCRTPIKHACLRTRLLIQYT